MREVLTPPLLYRTVLGASLGAIAVVGTAANGNWIVPWADRVAAKEAEEARQLGKEPKAKPNKAKTQMLRSSGGILGSLLGGVLATLVGRRLSYFLISLASLAASTIVFRWLDPSMGLPFSIASFLFGFVTIIYFGWLPLFLPELFPTRARATGTGISFNSGRIVAGVVALTTGFLLSLFGGDYSRIGFWTGMIYAVGMVIIWFAPRAEKRSIEK
jgi:hypothetical protein